MNTVTEGQTTQQAVLDYALCHLYVTLGHYLPEQIRKPEGLREGELECPVATTVAFFDDARLIIEYVRNHIIDEDQNEALGDFLTALDELKLLRLGDMTEFQLDHLTMLDVLSHHGDYDWVNFERINDPDKWKQWWISLSSHPARSLLTDEKLVTIGQHSLMFVYEDLHSLTEYVKDGITPRLMRFLLDAIAKGIYPWDYK